jgi:hypothetical protein
MIYITMGSDPKTGVKGYQIGMDEAAFKELAKSGKQAGTCNCIHSDCRKEREGGASC